MIYKKINIEDFWFFILFFTIAFLLLGAMICTDPQKLDLKF